MRIYNVHIYWQWLSYQKQDKTTIPKEKGK